MKIYPKILMPLDSRDEAALGHEKIEVLLSRLASTLHLITLKDDGDDRLKPSKNIHHLEEEFRKEGGRVEPRREHLALPEGLRDMTLKLEVDLLFKQSYANEGLSEAEQRDWEKLIRSVPVSVWLAKKGRRHLPTKILCPVDFSSPSKLALQKAVELCQLFEAELTILNVFEPMAVSFPSRLEIDYAAENQSVRARHRKELDEFLTEIPLRGVKYNRLIEAGEAAETIIEQAAEGQADLVVMGATGKSMLQRFLVGSVTDAVLRELPCSMLIVKFPDFIS